MPYKDQSKANENAKKNYAKRKKLYQEADPLAVEREEKRQARIKDYQEKNADRIKGWKQKWLEEHPGYRTQRKHITGQHKPWEEYLKDLEEKNKKQAAYMVEWNKTEAGQRARTARTLKEKFDVYGLTIEQYEEKWLQQDGKCEICKKEYPVYGQYRMHIDHDHKTGKVRGLLCASCNVVLGQSKDSTEVLENSAAYLRKHGN